MFEPKNRYTDADNSCKMCYIYSAYIAIISCCIIFLLIIIAAGVFGIDCGIGYLLFINDKFIFLSGIVPKTYWYYVADIGILSGMIVGGITILICLAIICVIIVYLLLSIKKYC